MPRQHVQPTCRGSGIASLLMQAPGVSVNYKPSFSLSVAAVLDAVLQGRGFVFVFQAAKRELERQRHLEWERQRRQELLTQRNREQESIVLLKARKKTLEFELEALVIESHVSTFSHL